MENKRSAADKVRPILEAMERSIDTARRRRVGVREEPTPAPVESHMPPSPEGNGIPRAKAKPKRPNDMNGHYDGRGYQSKAG